MTSEDLLVYAEATGVNAGHAAYALSEPKPWPLGRACFIAARWREVAQLVGMTDEELRPVRACFTEQFVQVCVTYINGRSE